MKKADKQLHIVKGSFRTAQFDKFYLNTHPISVESLHYIRNELLPEEIGFKKKDTFPCRNQTSNQRKFINCTKFFNDSRKESKCIYIHHGRWDLYQSRLII